MQTVKIRDVKTGAVKEVSKSLASDYVGTKKFVIVTEEKKSQSKPLYNEHKEEEK